MSTRKRLPQPIADYVNQSFTDGSERTTCAHRLSILLRVRSGAANKTPWSTEYGGRLVETRQLYRCRCWYLSLLGREIIVVEEFINNGGAPITNFCIRFGTFSDTVDGQNFRHRSQHNPRELLTGDHHHAVLRSPVFAFGGDGATATATLWPLCSTISFGRNRTVFLASADKILCGFNRTA